jgi:hypothetical protein
MGIAMSKRKSQGSVLKRLYGAKWPEMAVKIKGAINNSPKSSEHNLEYELLNSKLLVNKVISSEIYAQNLYAALCNNDFQKIDVIAALKETVWHCSWRGAGHIITDMREEGHYTDWYCSGMFGSYDLEIPEGYVSEGTVTDEVKQDLLDLGWVVK